MKKLKKITGVIAGIVMLGVVNTVSAEGYPEKTITMVVPYGAGGITDTMARITAAEMQESLGQKIVIVNKAGAAGTIGMSGLTRSRADGYTISMIPAAPLAIQPHLNKLPYGVDSFTYICKTFESPVVLATAKDSPFNTLVDVIDFAKKNPGKLTYGSAGTGSLPQISMLQLLKEQGATMRHVPMGGDAGAITGALGGHVDLAIIAGASVIGKETKNIAVFADKRLEVLPDAPTAKEAGFDANYSLWGGVIAPKGLPEEITAKLQATCETAVASASFAPKMAKLASVPAYLNGAEFRSYAQKRYNINGEIIQSLGLSGN